MKQITKLKDFDSFILEQKSTQKTSAVETALSQVKVKYGSLKDPHQFLDENGLDVTVISTFEI